MAVSSSLKGKSRLEGCEQSLSYLPTRRDVGYYRVKANADIFSVAHPFPEIMGLRGWGGGGGIPKVVWGVWT